MLSRQVVAFLFETFHECRESMAPARPLRRFSSFHRPALAILLAEILLRLRHARLQMLRIPGERLADAIGHGAQQYGLCQRSTIVEIARRRAAGLARLDPFLVMAERVRNVGRRRLVAGVLLLR